MQRVQVCIKDQYLTLKNITSGEVFVVCTHNTILNKVQDYGL